MGDVTQMLIAVGEGSESASSQLLPLVYDELRRLAAAKMAQESPGQTLEATALVHEAYLRLVGSRDGRGWDNRGHFFAAAAEAMRRILVESARRKSRLKHGGDRDREYLSDEAIAVPSRMEEILAVDDVLDKLEATNLEAAQLVKLRYFVGFTIADAAESLGVSPRHANKLWAYAKAWLLAELGDSVPAGESQQSASQLRDDDRGSCR